MAQLCRIVSVDRTSLPDRMDPCKMERLIGIDVPDPGDLALVEQPRANGGLRGAEGRMERARREALLERLGPHAGRARLPSVTRQALDGSEPPRVVEDQHAASLEAEAHGRVRPLARVRVVGLHRHEPSGHAEVHGDHPAAVEIDEDVLAPTAHALDRPAAHRAREAANGRSQHVRVDHLDAADRAPDDRGAQTSDDRFRFGQLGHRSAPYPPIKTASPRCRHRSP
jgi:hypothetical protein